MHRQQCFSVFSRAKGKLIGRAELFGLTHHSYGKLELSIKFISAIPPKDFLLNRR